FLGKIQKKGRFGQKKADFGPKIAKFRPKTPKLAQKLSQCATEFANLRRDSKAPSVDPSPAAIRMTGRFNLPL
ncbi:MAG: hypothetical protein OXD43_14160, partial [Bacteroidetes bacterium]|nr:hypothetical protein [Bacteroidota bacterium]